MAGESRQVTASLIDGVAALGDDDLVDPARHPWLNGRSLWLQIVVRGFWHPTGHVADYYLGHGQPGRAVALQRARARHDPLPGRPRPGSGHGRATVWPAPRPSPGGPRTRVRTLAEAIALNPDVRANADRDPDLEPLRGSGRLAAILTR